MERAPLTADLSGLAPRRLAESKVFLDLQAAKGALYVCRMTPRISCQEKWTAYFEAMDALRSSPEYKEYLHTP